MTSEFTPHSSASEEPDFDFYPLLYTQTHKSSTRLYYEVLGQAEPDRPPVLMLHGFAVRGDMFNPILRYYLNDHQVILPDLRGFARSAHVPGPMSMRHHAQDMLRLMDELDIEKVNVLGYSMGGLVAQQLAIDYPDRVQSLVLGCTWAYKSQTPGEMMLEVLTPMLFRGLGGRRALDFFYNGVVNSMGIGRDEKLATWYRDVMLSTPDHKLEEGARELYWYDSRAKLRHIQAPTLVLAGEADSIVPYYHQQALARMISGAELMSFENTGHGLIFSHPEALAIASRDFFDHTLYLQP